MKHKFVTLLVVFAGVLVFSPVFASERIDSFSATVKIDADATIQVSERIVYNFGELELHGIFREIPVKYRARGGNYKLRVSDISVTDDAGEPYKFSVSFPGNDVQIKIGDPDTYVTGIKSYVISYRVRRAINYFADHDELYWNVTGNGWKVPIDKANVDVVLPEEIVKADLRTTCYQGAIGSTETCQIAEPESSSTVVSMSAESLGAGEGLTAVIGWPKGFVAKPTAWQSFLEIVRDNWVLAVPFLVFFFMFYLWYTRGRDPKGRGTVVPEYEAPDGLAPSEVGVLIDEKADRKDISAQIISLAIRGYLKIVRLPDEGLIIKSHDYEFQKLKSVDDLKNEFEKRLMSGLFAGQAQSVKLSVLKNAFYKDFKAVSGGVYKSLTEKGYFLKSPEKVRGTYLAVGLLTAFFPQIFALRVFGVIGAVSFLLAGIIIVGFSFVMPRKTQKGAEAREKILGLREYMSVAEAERIKFHNAPEKNPDRFEKLLPYAMVLGVEQAWAKQFDGIYNQNPNWYTDSSGSMFNSLLLVHSLNSFSSRANSTLGSVPNSAGSGASGFGGGGFSGGGFGGGGGGSW